MVLLKNNQAITVRVKRKLTFRDSKGMIDTVTSAIVATITKAIQIYDMVRIKNS